MASNDQLAAAVQAQAEQLAKLSTLLNTALETQNSNMQVLLATQHQLQGYAGAFQVFAELIMVTSPAVKEIVATAIGQALARPDAIANETMRELLAAIHGAATSEPRITPEGRRANFQVVPGGEPQGEP